MVIEKIQNAIDYIETRLDGDIHVGEFAEASQLSVWHFQRVFAAIAGLPFKTYVRKRRLSVAFEELVKTETRILDIAIKFGFESQESFTRSFKQMFNETPGAIRKKGRILMQDNGRHVITPEFIDQLFGGTRVKPEIINLPKKTFIGMGERFISILSDDKTSDKVIPALWGALYSKAI